MSKEYTKEKLNKINGNCNFMLKKYEKEFKELHPEIVIMLLYIKREVLALKKEYDLIDEEEYFKEYKELKKEEMEVWDGEEE